MGASCCLKRGSGPQRSVCVWFFLDVGDHIPTFQLMWPGWGVALRGRGSGASTDSEAPTEALSSSVELEGPCAPHCGLPREQETLTSRKACLLIFGDVTAGEVAALTGLQPVGPHSHALERSSIGAFSFSFDLFLICFGSTKPANSGYSRGCPTISRLRRSFQDGAEVSSSPRPMREVPGREGLFFLGDLVGRWIWPEWGSSHSLLPPPREELALSAFGSFSGVTPPPPAWGALGTFHRKEAGQPTQGLLCLPFPVENVGKGM